MFKLTKLIKEIKQYSFITTDMLKDLYDELISNDLVSQDKVDKILSQYLPLHGITDLYRYNIFHNFDKLTPKQVTEIYKKLFPLKKNLEK